MTAPPWQRADNLRGDGPRADDAALIERSWHQPETFAELYDRHAVPLYRYVSRRLGEPMADDVVADTFLAAFRRRQGYDLHRPDARPLVGSIVSEIVPESQGQVEFDYLAQLLWNAYAAAPPTAEADVYRAVAGIPGVTVKTGLTNAVGRTAVGISAGGVAWLLLDPQTYQVIGISEKAVVADVASPSSKPRKHKKLPLRFSGMISMAWAEVAFVRGPGVR
jgi:hypothetical protein